MTIADIIRQGIAAGQTTAEVLAAVKASHPEANTSLACVAYYRSKMKSKDIRQAPAPQKAPAKKALAAAAATSTGYSVAKLKTFIGMEGHGFNVDLLLDGKKVAFVRDDADGGELVFEWIDDGRPKVPMGPKDSTWLLPATQGDLRDFVKGLAPMVCDFEDPNTGKPAVLAMTEDIYVTNLVQDLQWIREYKRITKKAIVYLKEGQLYSAKVEPTEKNLAGYKAKFPHFEIVNGLDDAKALEIMRKVA